MEAIFAKIVAFKETQESEQIFTGLSSKQNGQVHQFCKNNNLFSCTEKNGTLVKILKSKPFMDTEVKDRHRKAMIQYYSLPISLYDVRFFGYFVTLYDTMFGTKLIYQRMEEAIHMLMKRDEDLKEYAIKLSTTMIKDISESDAFKAFNEPKELHFDPPLPSTEFPSNIKNFYSRNPSDKEDCPKFFISLDIKKANYSAMKFFNPALIFHTDTWEEFVARYTDLEFFIHSKYFRQVVFGNLNNSRINTIQKYLQTFLFYHIKDLLKIRGRMWFDELIIETTAETYKADIEKVHSSIAQLPEKMRSLWRIVPFHIIPLGQSNVFVRTNMETGQVDFKNVDKDFYAQAYKFYYGLPLEEFDMKTMEKKMDVEFVLTYDKPYPFA